MLSGFTVHFGSLVRPMAAARSAMAVERNQQFGVARRQKDHFMALVGSLNRRSGVQRGFALCHCGIPS